MNRVRSARWLAVSSMACIMGLGAYSILSPQRASQGRAQAGDVESSRMASAPRTRSWPSRQALPPRPALAAAALKVGNVFDDPKRLDKLQTDLGPITGALEPERGRERFRALGIDTVENKDRAVALARRPYSSVQREEVRRRVLAQYFLTYSEQLSLEECMDILLADADEVRANHSGTDRTRIYALDVLVMAKICARIDERAVTHMAENESHGTVRSQLFFALASVHEQSE